MDDPKQKDDRWRELAELLGLPPEKGAEKKSPPPVPPPTVVSARVEEARVAPAQEVTPVARPEPPQVEPESPRMEPIPDESSADWEAEFDDDRDEVTAVDEPESVGPEGMEADEPTSASGEPTSAAEGEEKGRGRRRRRRGRRRGGADRAEAGPRDPNAPPAPAEGNADRKGTADRPPRAAAPEAREGRGRGRRSGGRRDDETPRRAPVPLPVHVDEPLDADDLDDTPPRKMEALAVEDTDFSNWNVPAWQDLIASLYRPDR